jgi:hypothetical protein
MDVIRRELRSAWSATVPRGRIMRLELRASVDTLVALAVTLGAAAMAVGYQVFRLRAAGSSADWH